MLGVISNYENARQRCCYEDGEISCEPQNLRKSKIEKRINAKQQKRSWRIKKLWPTVNGNSGVRVLMLNQRLSRIVEYAEVNVTVSVPWRSPVGDPKIPNKPSTNE